MDFYALKAPVEAQFQHMTKYDVFSVAVTGDELWERYLSSFPEGSNPTYRIRTEHDCSCCRRFVKTLGGAVCIVDGKIQTIWDCKSVDPAYQAVADAMSEMVKARAIDRPFLHSEKHVGSDKNYGEVDGEVRTFDHFHVEIPWGRNAGKTYFCAGKDIPTKIGEMKATHDVFLRSLQTLTIDAVDTVLEVIANKSLYRGDEHKFAVTEFGKAKRLFEALPTEAERSLFAWANYDKVPGSVARIRNTAIGELLIDLSGGLDLEDAVRKFERSIMAPENYKRPTALVSQTMIDSARRMVKDLGLLEAMERRHARLTDISVNNILFADRSARKAITGGVFDEIVPKISTPKNLDKVETVSIDTFITNIIPKAESIEVMLENRHAGNLVSLIAPQHGSARPMFKWGNGFSWSYNGEVTDSIKERVKQAGGNVTGDLCCRLAWSNFDDLDFHMYEPGHKSMRDGREIGFYNRQSAITGGMLDVDMNAGGRTTRTPVENIFYTDRRRMIEGEYILLVNQYQRRETIDVGFEAEIDWLGDVKRFHYDKPVTGKVVVARMKYTHAKGIEIIESLPSAQASRTVWGLKTQDFHRVTTVMHSPNFWTEGDGSGNKHFFFMLDGCRNEEGPRGFFNEFLIDELTPYRKVLEIVGSKSRVEPSADQLSGLGFSSTQRNELLVRAKGSYSRTIRVAF